MTDTVETFMEPDDETDIHLTEYDITSAPNDFNVMTITSFLETGSIILPPYQRNYTWDKRRASKLIKSLVLGLPVPQLFLYEEGKNRFAILDGQQRLMSVYFFRKKRFPRKEKRAELREIFAQKGVYPDSLLSDDKYFEPFNIYLPAVGGEEKSPLHGLNYDTMGDYQSTLNLRAVRCVIIKQNSPNNDNSSVYEIFDRLNTGSVNLKPQEIRANLYYSPFYELLYRINRKREWRRVFGQEDRDNNLRDIELLLRAFAMLCYHSEYRPSIIRFLNRFSNYAKSNFVDDDINFLEGIFSRFLAAIEQLDPALFRLADKLFL